MQWSQTRKPLAVNMTPLLSGTGGLIIQMRTGQAPLQGTSNNHNCFVGSIVGAAPMILAHNLS